MSAYTYNSAALYSISINGRTICPQQEKICIFCTLPDTLLKIILTKTPSFSFISNWFLSENKKIIRMGGFFIFAKFFLTVPDEGSQKPANHYGWGVKRAASPLSVSL